MPWRAEDQVLLERLENEVLVEAVFARALGKPLEQARPSDASVPPRAGGIVAEIRRLPGGAEVVRVALAGDVGALAAFVDGLRLEGAPPALLHHLALLRARIARTLELPSPEAAATAWVRSLAAWLALAEERHYLAALEDAVLGPRTRGAADARITPERVPLEWLADVARRAEDAARELAPPGRAALLALARTDEAAVLAGASADTAKRTRAFAERHKNAAVEAALTTIGEALDEANVRGDLMASGGQLLRRALEVWAWAAHDESVEHFVVDRVDKIGWQLYRAKRWEDLRQLLEPHRRVFDSLAARIERDPTQIAYAAGCAQMFVFLAELEPSKDARRKAAERALVVCPTHRNGRLILAASLCEEALDAMRAMAVFTRRGEVERVEALLARAEALYPTVSALGEARAMLERVKKDRIKI